MPTVNFDLEDPGTHVHKITVTKDFDVAFLNPPVAGKQITFEMEIAHDGLTSNTWTVTLPTSVRQLSTISIPPNGRGVYVFRTNDNGANYDVVQVVAGTTGTGSGSGWSTFPALQDVNIASFNLTSIGGINSNAASLPSVGKIKLGSNELLGWLKTDLVSTVNFGLGLGNTLDVLGADLSLQTNNIVGVGRIDSDAANIALSGKIRLGNNESLSWLKTDNVTTVTMGSVQAIHLTSWAGNLH